MNTCWTNSMYRTALSAFWCCVLGTPVLLGEVRSHFVQPEQEVQKCLCEKLTDFSVKTLKRAGEEQRVPKITAFIEARQPPLKGNQLRITAEYTYKIQCSEAHRKKPCTGTIKIAAEVTGKNNNIGPIDVKPSPIDVTGKNCNGRLETPKPEATTVEYVAELNGIGAEGTVTITFTLICEKKEEKYTQTLDVEGKGKGTMGPVTLKVGNLTKTP